MKCDNCKKEIKVGEEYHTAVGIKICQECKDNGAQVTIDMVLNKSGLSEEDLEDIIKPT